MDTLINYNDGGAFAECHFVQYPGGFGHGNSVMSTSGNIASTGSSSRGVVGTSGPAVATTTSLVVHAPSAAQAADDAEYTRTRTAEALAAALRARKAADHITDDNFGGSSSNNKQARPTPGSLALAVVADASANKDPAPIVRSPPKTTRRSALEVAVPSMQLDATTPALASSSGPSLQDNATAVPFCVSNWRNKNKLIVPVDQRLALHKDDRASGSGIGDNVMQLAMAMRQATQDVTSELQARSDARAREEERRQAAIEAEESEKAKKLVEENLQRVAASSQRRETREQRLERLRSERELREREKVVKQRQRMLEKAAARLNMSVEDLEADDKLLRSVEDPTQAASSSSTAPVATTTTAASKPVGALISSVHDEADGDEGLSGMGRGMKASINVLAHGVVSNEGIAREMEALAQLERDGDQHQQHHHHGNNNNNNNNDGIRLPGESEDEDEDDGFDMNQLVRKRQRKL